jgi:hypothetical protein
LKPKKFSDRSPAEKASIGFIFVVSVAVVSFAERDIQRRDDAEIRGPKLAWRVAALNALGALAYLGLGRR